MNAPHNTNPAILKQKIKDISDAPSGQKKKELLWLRGISDSEQGYYRVQSQVEVGKEYTYFIDGVEYTGIGTYESPDYMIELYNTIGEIVCYVYNYGIKLSDTFLTLVCPIKLNWQKKFITLPMILW